MNSQHPDRHAPATHRRGTLGRGRLTPTTNGGLTITTEPTTPEPTAPRRPDAFQLRTVADLSRWLVHHGLMDEVEAAAIKSVEILATARGGLVVRLTTYAHVVHEDGTRERYAVRDTRLEAERNAPGMGGTTSGAEVALNVRHLHLEDVRWLEPEAE